MDDTGKAGQGQAGISGHTTIHIKDIPVMQSALDVMALLGSGPGIVLCAKGDSIPNAVAVANILTEKMMAGRCKIQKITLDTADEPGIGRMLSTIEIMLGRN